MPLWSAAVLLALAAVGIALSRRYLQGRRTARRLCLLCCGAVAVGCAVYIGLALLLVAAVEGRPPVS